MYTVKKRKSKNNHILVRNKDTAKTLNEFELQEPQGIEKCSRKSEFIYLYFFIALSRKWVRAIAQENQYFFYFYFFIAISRKWVRAIEQETFS